MSKDSVRAERTAGAELDRALLVIDKNLGFLRGGGVALMMF